MIQTSGEGAALVKPHHLLAPQPHYLPSGVGTLVGDKSETEAGTPRSTDRRIAARTESMPPRG